MVQPKEHQHQAPVLPECLRLTLRRLKSGKKLFHSLSTTAKGLYRQKVDGQRAHGPYSPSDNTQYAHTDLSRITTELWEIPVFSPADGAILLHVIK